MKGPALVLVAAAVCGWARYGSDRCGASDTAALAVSEPELVRLRNDLLNLSAAEAELHLDIHRTAHATRVMVDAVAARCRAAGIPPPGWRSPGWRRASCLSARASPPGPLAGHLWEALMETGPEEWTRRRRSAWHRASATARRQPALYRHVSRPRSRAYREHAAGRTAPGQSWHAQLANIIATVMQGTGTARVVPGATRSGEPWAGYALGLRAVKRHGRCLHR